MFISSLISIASLAYAEECPDGDASCEPRPAPPLVILEPTKSPDAQRTASDAPPEEDPPLVIVAPVPDGPVAHPPADCDDHDEEAEDCDTVVVSDRDDGPERFRHRRRLMGQYAMQFLGDGPAHQLAVRSYSKRDSYFGAEVRYLPGNDAILWSGRLGAGFDLFGASPLDLQLGLFLGSAGEWFVLDGGDALYHSPILGSEVRFAYDTRHLFASYRLLGGFGVGPLQRFLSERELIIGYKVTPAVQVFGESVRIDPRNGDHQWSVGLGGRLVL